MPPKDGPEVRVDTSCRALCLSIRPQIIVGREKGRRSSMDDLTEHQKQEIIAAGTPPEPLENLSKALQVLFLPPQVAGEELEVHSSRARQIYQAGDKLLSSLPPKPKRNPAQARAADLIKGTLRNTRNLFAHAYVEFIFGRITRSFSRFIRAEDLVFETADLCPGLCPTRKEVAVDSHLPLAAKEGVEIAQTDFLAHVFANRAAGLYLIHSMLQPLPQSRELWRNSSGKKSLTLERELWGRPSLLQFWWKRMSMGRPLKACQRVSCLRSRFNNPHRYGQRSDWYARWIGQSVRPAYPRRSPT